MSLRWAVNCTQWIPSKPEWLSALGCLQAEEIDRIGRFVYQRDSKFALVGRILIRAAVSSLLGLTNHQIRLTRSEKGKPLLISCDGTIDTCAGFNVSHQGDFAVLAAELAEPAVYSITVMNVISCPVGVDVMKFTKPRGVGVSEFFVTMRRQFTAREWDQIKQPGTSQLSNFYRFWCLKESFIKAEGTGLSYGLQNLEFHTNPSHQWPPSLNDVCEDSVLFVKGRLATEWTFQESLIDDQHCVAVATSPNAGKRQSGQFEHITMDYLLHCLNVGIPEWSSEHAHKLWTDFTSKSPTFDRSKSPTFD